MPKCVIVVALLLIVELYLPRLIHAQEWLSGFSHKLVEDRFKTDLTLKKAFAGMIFSNRCRFEWQNVEADPRSRYRNRAQIDYPMKWGSERFTPYLASEFIYDIKDDNLEEHRNVMGVSKKFGKHVKASLFYMIKTTSSSSSEDDGRIIGTQFDIFFD